MNTFKRMRLPGTVSIWLHLHPSTGLKPQEWAEGIRGLKTGADHLPHQSLKSLFPPDQRWAIITAFLSVWWRRHVTPYLLLQSFNHTARSYWKVTYEIYKWLGSEVVLSQREIPIFFCSVHLLVHLPLVNSHSSSYMASNATGELGLFNKAK